MIYLLNAKGLSEVKQFLKDVIIADSCNEDQSKSYRKKQFYHRPTRNPLSLGDWMNGGYLKET